MLPWSSLALVIQTGWPSLDQDTLYSLWIDDNFNFFSFSVFLTVFSWRGQKCAAYGTADSQTLEWERLLLSSWTRLKFFAALCANNISHVSSVFFKWDILTEHLFQGRSPQDMEDSEGVPQDISHLLRTCLEESICFNRKTGLWLASKDIVSPLMK